MQERTYDLVRLNPHLLTSVGIEYPIQIGQSTIKNPPIECLIVNPFNNWLMNDIKKIQKDDSWNIMVGNIFGIVPAVFFFDLENYNRFVSIHMTRINLSRTITFDDLEVNIK